MLTANGAPFLAVGLILYLVSQYFFEQVLDGNDADDSVVTFYRDQMCTGADEFAEHGIERRHAANRLDGVQLEVADTV